MHFRSRTLYSVLRDICLEGLTCFRGLTDRMQCGQKDAWGWIGAPQYGHFFFIIVPSLFLQRLHQPEHVLIPFLRIHLGTPLHYLAQMALR